jgi:TP901 family phage tail tape measure protein
MADEQIVTSIVAKADLSSLVSEVHRATVSLQQLQRELLASNKSIASATKVANNLFRDTLTGSGYYSSHFVNLNSDVDKFGKQLDAGRLKLKDYFQTFRTHATTQRGMIRELAKEQVMLQNSVLQPLGRNAQGLMQYNVMIPRGLDAVKNSAQLARMEMQIMNRALLEGSTSLINWGKNTQWAGRQLTVGLTVPLAMFGAQAAKAFREADQELTRLVKVYGDISGTASADLQKIREEVTSTAKELSSAMGVSFKETIGLAADIAATGQQGDQLLGSLKETTRLAVLGEVDRAEAMKATLAIQTAFKSNTQELTESINFLNAVENQTSTTLNDLVEAIPKAGTVVKQLGGDVEDLALYLTAMREGGVNASEAANALKSGLASMINPTKQTVGLMADFGIDILGMVERNAGSTTGMILDLQKALDNLDPLSKARALEQMFGKFQFARMSALFNNLGKEGSQTLQVMQLMNASAEDLANVASRELSLVTESASGKYKRAVESLKASMADIGEEFLGVATKFINAFTKVLDFFNNLPEPIKKAVTYLGGFTAIIGPVIMLTGVLANFFGYITKGVVQLRAFFQRAAGWKMLTPEIIAAEKAAQMVEQAFYSDAAAAEVLHGALTKLVADYMNLQNAMLKGSIPTNPVLSTVGGTMLPIRREVDPANVYAGDMDTRAMSHINVRDPKNPASLMGVVPGALPVNRGIGRTPQMYMSERLPNIEGLTSVKGISTGIVAGEAARFHALMATLGMQTEAEVAALKQTIAMGGTVSKELLDTFDDILPITAKIADGAATQSAAIVAQLRAGKITVDQAKAEIVALNAQIDAMLRSEISAYATSRGRAIDFTKAPLMNQPVVDANGQFTLRDLYKKEANKAVMEEFGRLRGVRTFGAPYSMHVTRLPKFNEGGAPESFGANKTVVSGPTSVTYDDRLGNVPLGGFVLNQSASMNPANADLVAAAPSTYMNNGGNITAALTPGEVVFGPGIQNDPELYARVEAANRGIPGGNVGGRIRFNKIGYGLPMPASVRPSARLAGARVQTSDRATIYEALVGRSGIDQSVLASLRNWGTTRQFGMQPGAFAPRAHGPYDVAGGLDIPHVGYMGQAQVSRHNELQNILSKSLGVRNINPITPFSSQEMFAEIITKGGGAGFRRYAYIDDVMDIGKAKRYLEHFEDVFYGKARWKSAEFGLKPSMLLKEYGKKPDELSTYLNYLLDEKAVTTTNKVGIIFNDAQAILAKLKVSPDEAISMAERAYAKTMSQQPLTDDEYYALRLLDFEEGGQFASFRNSFNRGGKIPGYMAGGNLGYLYSRALSQGQLKDVALPRTYLMKALGATSHFDPATRRSMVSSLPMRPNLSMFDSLPISRQAKLALYDSLVESVQYNRMNTLDKNIKRGFGVNDTRNIWHSALSGALLPSRANKLGAADITVLKGLEDRISRLQIDMPPSVANKLFGGKLKLNRGGRIPGYRMGGGIVSRLRGAYGTTDELKRKIAQLRSQGALSVEDEERMKRALRSGQAQRISAVASEVERASQALIKQEKAFRSYSVPMQQPDVDELGHKTQPMLLGRKPVEVPEGKQYRRFFGYTFADFQAKYGRRAVSPITPMSVDTVGYTGISERGGAVPGNAYAARINNPEIASILRLTSMPLNNALDKLRDALEKPLTAIRNAIVFQNKQLQKPAVLSGLSSSRELVHVPGLGKTYGRDLATIPEFRNRFNADAAALAAKNMMGPDGRPMPMYGNLTGTAAYRSLSLMSNYDENGRYIGGPGGFQQSRLARLLGQQGIGRDAMRQAGRYASAWKPAGEGVYTRKGEGFLGLRRREFLVTNPQTGQQEIINRSEATRRGIYQGPQMGMGSQMGMMMASSAGGMYLMGQDPEKRFLGMNPQMAGMALMTAGSTLPFMMGPAVKGMMNMKAAMSGVKASAGSLFNVISAAKFLSVATGVGAVTTALLVLQKVNNNWNQDAANRFGLTKKAAEELGVEYFNIAERMKSMKAAQDAQRAAALSGAQVGVPGLMMDPQKMQQLKESAGKQFKESIESINRADSSNIVELVTNLKSQMIGLGVSAEEANKNILGMMMASNNANLTFKVFANSGFSAIVDRATAAKSIFANLRDEIDNPGDQFGTKMIEGFSSLLNITDQAINNLVGTKNATYGVIDEAEALKIVLDDFRKNSGFDKVIGTEAFNELPKELQAVLNATDTIGSSIAKWRIYLTNTTMDIKNMSAETALMLDNWNASFESATTALQNGVKGDSSTFGSIGKALKAIDDIQNKVSKNAQRAYATSQKNAQEELKLIQKKISLIEEEKNKKLEALRATQDRENYQLELQKLQIEYQDAIARGDMSAAARAQIEIQQLSKQRQFELAQQALEDAAEKKKKPLLAQAERVQKKSDKAGAAYQSAGYAAEDAGSAKEKLVDFENRYGDLLNRMNFEPTVAKPLLDSLISEIQKAGTAKGADAKYIRQSFGDLFTADGKAKNFFNPKVDTKGMPTGTASHLQDFARYGARSGLDAMYARDLQAANAQADKIVKGLGGNATLANVVAAIRGDKATSGQSKATNITVTSVGYGTNSASYTTENLTKRKIKEGDYVTGKNGVEYKVGKTVDGRTYLVPRYNSGGPVSRAQGGRFVPGKMYSLNDGGKIEGIKFDAPGTIYPNAMTMPKYNVGGPITSMKRNYGNPPPSNTALYNIKVELNGSDLNPQDVARAIRREMEVREMMSGPGRKY